MNPGRPVLLLDEARARNNLERMTKKVDAARLRFRPHFKTHQSHEIGRWFREKQVDAITVSSLSMAIYFIADGWTDITIAFPLNIHEIKVLNTIPEAISLGLLVNSPTTALKLCETADRPYNCWIEADTGFGRSGIEASDSDAFRQIIHILQSNPHLFVAGLLSHFGHTYQAKDKAEVSRIYNTGMNALQALRNRLQPVCPDMQISVGDTPSCSMLDDFGEADELRPGNFIYYDLMQAAIGSCRIEDIAVALSVPVVEIHHGKRQLIVHGGAIHLSKDSMPGEHGQPVFGRVSRLEDKGWGPPLEGVYVKSLSQEHGVLQFRSDIPADIETGSLLGILPVHSCLTADAAGACMTTGGAFIGMLDKRLVY
ncbi:MAG TPA: alanine racemase [Bacteroidales bacterium]|nr:alanine racemase [Bacteroidales bacterium]HSA43728.1 alanine racemase [Bacteroidales bacterium]